VSSVERILCYSAKGMPAQRLEQVRLIKDFGMHGDYHGTGGDRQITLISQKAKDWMESQEIKGLCFAKFHENIVIRDIILNDLPKQARLKIGEAVLELSPIRKKCFPEFCELDQNRIECLLIKEVRFAKVITGGDIAVGMEIVIGGA
jgi:cyclic pyranopterin monophosphate synthase